MVHLLLATLLTAVPATETAGPPPSPAAAAVKGLVEQADKEADRDVAAALALLDRAAALATESANRELELEVLQSRCWIVAVLQPGEVEALVATAEPLPEATRAKWTRRFDLCRGWALERSDRGAEAIAAYDRVIAGARADTPHDAPTLARALAFRGEQRAAVGRYADAIEDLKAAWEIEEAGGSESRRLYVLNAIANLYADRHVAQYERALEYHQMLREAHQRANRLANLATAHFNIASTYEAMGRLEEAVASYRAAWETDQRRGDLGEAAYDLRAMAVTLNKLGRPAEALPLLDQALATFRSAGDRDHTAMAVLSRGVTLRHLGRHREALADLDTALAHYEAAQNTRFLAKIHEERAAVLAATGDFRAAHDALVAQLAAERRLGEQLVDERTARLRVEFDTARKEQENRALAREGELKDAALAASGQALAAAQRVRQLQLIVLGLSAVVIASLGLLASRRASYARRMRDLALTDELTRLANRRHLVTKATETMALAVGHNQPLSLVALDIDHFKRVNDTLGHAAGDHVLQRVAHVARTGGEELVALLPATGRDEAIAVAERLRAAVAALDCSAIAPDLHVTVSLGVAAREPGDHNLEAVWKRADDALYRAKSEGRNRVAVAPASTPASDAATRHGSGPFLLPEPG